MNVAPNNPPSTKTWKHLIVYSASKSSLMS